MELNKRKRTVFFWSFFVLFIVTGFILTLYVNNIKIDFKNKKVIQTGGIYLRVLPKEKINVYLDGQKQNIGMLPIFQRLFFDNLFPKKYSLEIKREGYFSWSKDLDVKKGMVTAASHITLLPKNLENLSEKEKIGNFDNFWFINKKYILTLKKSRFSLNFFLFDKDSTEIAPLAKIKVNLKNNPIILNPKFNNKNLILIPIKFETKKINYYLIDISELEDKKIKLYLFPTAISKKIKENNKIIKIELSNNKDYIFLGYKDSLYQYDYKNKDIKLLIKPSNLKTFFIDDSNLFYIDNNGLSRKNLYQKKQEIVIPSSTKIELSSSTKLFFSTENNIVIILNNNYFYIYNIKEKKFSPAKTDKPFQRPERFKFDNKIKKILLSPKSRKIVVALKNQIKIYYLQDYFSDYIHKSGEFDILPINTSEIYWYKDFNHLIIKDTDSNLLFTEIDNRDNLNVYKLISNIKKILYSQKENCLYIIKGNFLLKIEIDKYL